MARIYPLGVLVTQYEIKTQQNPFHFKLLYVMMHEWALEHEYAPSDADPDFPEISYFESSSQQRGKETWIKWRLHRVPQDNPFYRRVLNIDIHAARMKPVDVMHEGKKYRLEQGELYIFCQAILELDWKGEWRRHWLLKHLLSTFWQRVIHRDIEKHKKEVYKDAYEMHNLIKEYLEIKKTIPILKSFWPEKGIKTQLK